MRDSVTLTSYKNKTDDNTFWKPILTQAERQQFKKLMDSVEITLKTGTNNEKGKALENLMTFIYSRFVGVDVIPNIRLLDNQIDHEIIFPDFGAPNFVVNCIGPKLIGESKNHKGSISSREVDNLDGLLKIRHSKLGIFSSYYSFSRGKRSIWENAEGKRRKLALFSNFNRVIIGFHFGDFKKILEGSNFYSMIKEKYNMLIDEVDDDYVEDNKNPYHIRVLGTLEYLSKVGIIPDQHLDTYKQRLIEKYGEFD